MSILACDTYITLAYNYTLGMTALTCWGDHTPHIVSRLHIGNIVSDCNDLTREVSSKSEGEFYAGFTEIFLGSLTYFVEECRSISTCRQISTFKILKPRHKANDAQHIPIIATSIGLTEHAETLTSTSSGLEITGSRTKHESCSASTPP